MHSEALVSIFHTIHSPRTRGWFLATSIVVYAVVAWFATDLALAVHRPCASDFEGGCGYGKAWAGVLAWLAAWIAALLAASVGVFATVMRRFRIVLICTAIILGLPPAAYLLYGVYSLSQTAVELLK